MEYPFSEREKAANAYWASSKAHKDGESTDSVGTMSAIQEDSSFNTRLDYMNFDSYSGWWNSPPPMTDQMFVAFASSSSSSSSSSFLQSMPTGYPSTFDSSSFGDYDVMNESYGKFCSEENMFQQMDYSLFHHLPTDSTRKDDDDGGGGGDDFLCKVDVCKNVSDTENYNNMIPKSPSKPLSEKMLNALSLFKDSSGVGILAQVWVPIKEGDHHILSTWEQPFLLDQMLAGYREVSRLFTFSIEVTPGSIPGLPGRVFASRVPEWTSNIVHYNKEEYLRMEHAVNHKIRGSIAVPVFEDFEDDDPDNSTCCAVLELVTMKEKPDFDQEMENVCRALQAVNLKSTSPPRFRPQCLSKNQTSALAEITDVLRAICHAHKLPLALTWIPCSYTQGIGDETIQVQIRGSNRGSNGKSILCIENTACYVNNQEMQGYVLACEEHYLEEGQGVAGKALQSNHPFFFPDVRSYDISEYPLVHHARKFGLNAAVAIRLRSTYTEDDDYILELFLPVNMKGSTEQQLLLNSLAGTMQRICKSLRTVSEPIDGNLSSVTNITINVSSSEDGREQASRPRKQQMEKKRSSAEKNVSLSVLQQYFSGSLKDAAKRIGVCPTTLKRICRQHGISRWPSRKINKVNRSLKKIQTVLDSVQGVEGGLKYDPASGALVASGSITQEPPSKDLESLSPVSPGFALPITTCGDDDGVKGRNQPTSSGMTYSSGSTGQGSSSSSESFGERQNNKMQTGSEEGGSKVSVKATYKEDTIRFKFEASGGCEKLFEEISERFKLQLGTFQVKYLDDEEEWVMLVTDSDLLECLEILEFVGSRTVKFLVRDISCVTGSSGSSNCFLMGGS